jgi:hypothetical protein
MSTATLSTRFSQFVPRHIRLPKGLIFGLILLGALLAFELFNYSTTEFALHDLLGDLSFMSVTWSTILALAFCGIDFAGIARLFTTGQDENQVGSAWYLFAAWLLAAAMNAMLTWWGVSIAILERQSQGSALVDHQTLLTVVPIFVAVLVWLIRILMIGTFSATGSRLFSQDEQKPSGKVERPLRRDVVLNQQPNPGVSPHTNSPQQPQSQPQPRYKPVSTAVVSHFKPPVGG